MTSKRKETEALSEPTADAAAAAAGGSEAKKMTTKASLRAGSVEVYLEDFFDTFCMLQDTKTKRYLANIFYLLPSAKDYPDYYDVIKNPIDLKQVAQKILNSTYKTLKQLETDLVLMTDNAKRYNDPKSVVYKDAHKLKMLSKDLYQELTILMQQGKPYVSKATPARTRETKRELIEEIAELTEEDFNKMLTNQSKSSAKDEEADEAGDEDEEDEDADDESHESEDEEAAAGALNTSGRKTAAASASKVDKPLQTAMNTLYEFIKDVKYQGVNIIDPFMRLPSKRVYPDYYEEIKKPISMQEIQRDIKKGAYPTLKTLVDDFVLMCRNAMTYNIEESLIYTHAKHILTLLQKKSEELHQSLGLSAADFNASSPVVKKTAAKSGAGSASVSRQPTQRSQHVVEHSIKRLFKLLMDYCGGEEAAVLSSLNKHGTGTSSTVIPGGRGHDKTILSLNFMHVPTREQQPDYYEKIREPIDFDTVQKRVDANGYASEAELVADCRRVLDNAKAYYAESTPMHKDAVKLDAYLTHRYQLLMSRQNINKLDLSDSNIHDEAATTTTSGKTRPGGSKSVIPKFADLKEKLVFLYNYINDYQLEMRELAPPFRHLPPKTEYPDYYNIIKKPIDMTKIWNRINQHGHTSAYTGMDDMCAEFAQMFENACIYNEPTSMIYKDALTMQRALFLKRDEIINSELHAHAHTADPLDHGREQLPGDYVANAVHELIAALFDACMQYQDTEGRLLSESFYELYSLFLRHQAVAADAPEHNDKFAELVTFDMIRARIERREYRRLDVFQDEMCQVFNQVRFSSYLPETLDESAAAELNFDAAKTFRIHRFSQLFKDAYDLQRYFITKRDEMCRNGDLLLTGALNYKFSSLDGHIAAIVGAPAVAFDESDALLVEQRFRPLEKRLTSGAEGAEAAYRVGQFYYFDRALVVKYFEGLGFRPLGQAREPTTALVGCVLARGPGRLVVQLYLRPGDNEFIGAEVKKMRRFYPQEAFKSDLYALVDLAELVKTQPTPRACECVALKDFVVSEPSVLTAEDMESSDASNDATEPPRAPPADMGKEDIFVCESMFSSKHQYFRKLVVKKWCPLSLVASGAASTPDLLVKFTKRSIPFVLQRQYEDEAAFGEVVKRVAARLAELARERSLFLPFYRETIEYDSPPASALREKDQEDAGEQVHSLTCEIDPELMKTAKYYEQLLFEGEPYKLGDYVYVRQQTPAADGKPPMIIRIDRLWSTAAAAGAKERKYYLTGPLFLRPTEIMHEPTRLFYHNEVFQELSREITTSLDQIVVSDRQTQSRRCCVMAAKRFVSCRPTEVPEPDVYLCDAKYSLQHKTFRKFTKGLRKFELSVKCNEDEIYFLRRELQLRKHLSPILVKMNINYDEIHSAGSDAGDGDDSNDHRGAGADDYWSEMMRDDENSSHSLTLNASTLADQSLGLMDSSFSGRKGDLSAAQQKKMRVKRAKKTGFNMFSREFRKSLRDTHSSLSFTDMSKEVGNRWRALTDKERAAYEEKARIETIKEAQKMAAEAKAKEESQQLLASPKHPSTPSGGVLVGGSMGVMGGQQQQQQSGPHHANHINHILAAQAAQQVQPMQSQQQQAQQGHMMAIGTTTMPNGQVYINTAQQGVYQNVQQYNPAMGAGGQQQATAIVYQQGPNNTLIAKPASPMLVAYPNQVMQPQQIQIQAQGQAIYQQQNIYQTGQPMQQQQQQQQIQFAPQQIVLQQQPQQQQVMSQPAPQQQHLIQPIYEIQQMPVAQVRHTETPKQAIHREAYMKYIAGLRKQQKPSHHYHVPEWHTSLDVRAAKFNENNMLPPPTAWIENCTSGNLLKHLVSLRYHLLEDSINIQKFVTREEDEDEHEAEADLVVDTTTEHAGDSGDKMDTSTSAATAAV